MVTRSRVNSITDSWSSLAIANASASTSWMVMVTTSLRPPGLSHDALSIDSVHGLASHGRQVPQRLRRLHLPGAGVTLAGVVDQPLGHTGLEQHSGVECLGGGQRGDGHDGGRLGGAEEPFRSAGSSSMMPMCRVF